MSTLFPQTISYKQISGAYNRGRWEKMETLSSFIGSVQPMDFAEADSLEVGRDDLGKVKVYSNTELNVSREGTDKSGDVVIWQGKLWEIIQGMNFQNDIISHYKYIAEYRAEAA